MLASSFLASDVFPLKKTDTVASSKVFFEDFGVLQLPVVDSGVVLGYIDYNNLEDIDPETTVSELIRPYTTPLPSLNDHFFEVIKIIADNQYNTIPVIQSPENMVLSGIVSQKSIVAFLGLSSLSQPGSIITLEMNVRDYSLAELSRIIEYNDQKIIGLFLTPAAKESTKIHLSVKLNTTDIKTTLVTLERYGYTILSVHQFKDIDSDMSSRFNWLVKYLNT